MRFWAALSLIPSLACGVAAGALGPDVQLVGRKVIGKAAAHHAPTEQTIEIVETEDCAARAQSPNTLELAGNCRFLSGVYRYVYVPEGETTKRQVVTGFSLTVPGAASHVLLVSTPMTLVESAR